MDITQCVWHTVILELYSYIKAHNIVTDKTWNFYENGKINNISFIILCKACDYVLSFV